MRFNLRTLLAWLCGCDGRKGIEWDLVCQIEKPGPPLTDRVRKVLSLSNTEAKRLNHEYIGPEHLLLGILEEGSGVAALVLQKMSGDARRIQAEMDEMIIRGPNQIYAAGVRPMTPRAKRVIDHAREEARRLGHDFIGTEHVLMGLTQEPESLPAQVLLSLGMDAEHIGREVRSILGIK